MYIYIMYCYALFLTCTVLAISTDSQTLKALNKIRIVESFLYYLSQHLLTISEIILHCRVSFCFFLFLFGSPGTIASPRKSAVVSVRRSVWAVEVVFKKAWMRSGPSSWGLDIAERCRPMHDEPWWTMMNDDEPWTMTKHDEPIIGPEELTLDHWDIIGPSC